jgi:homoserine kinase
LVRVTAPASTANLGPGFDCLGAALTCSLTVTVRDGTPDPGALVYRAAEKVLGQVPRCALDIDSSIPIGRGLGSSGAVTAAGLLVGCALAGREPDLGELVRLGTTLEGHPDNVAASLYGGITLVTGAQVLRFAPVASVRPLILMPREQLPTSEARQVLPERVALADAVSNIARVSALVAVLSGAVEPTARLLLESTEDSIHQPYRAELMPRTAKVIRHLREHGVAAALSGAGPSVVCLMLRREENKMRFLARYLEGWELLDLDWDRQGARIIEP